jgi:hypothetical protein
MHYLDDICVYSKNWTEQLQHLALVFERLSTYGLTCALEKCTFGRPRLKYLGHVGAVLEAKSLGPGRTSRSLFRSLRLAKGIRSRLHCDSSPSDCFTRSEEGMEVDQS